MKSLFLVFGILNELCNLSSLKSRYGSLLIQIVCLSLHVLMSLVVHLSTARSIYREAPKIIAQIHIAS